EAARRLSAALADGADLVLDLRGYRVPLPLEELGIRLDVPGSVTAAQAVGRRGSLRIRLSHLAQAITGTYTVKPRWSVDDVRFARATEALARRLAAPPRNARLE